MGSYTGNTERGTGSRGLGYDGLANRLQSQMILGGNVITYPPLQRHECSC